MADMTLFTRINRELAPANMRELFEQYIATSISGAMRVVEIDDRIVGMFGIESRSEDSTELRRSPSPAVPDEQRAGPSKAEPPLLWSLRADSPERVQHSQRSQHDRDTHRRYSRPLSTGGAANHDPPDEVATPAPLPFTVA
jgi:hypothetical protein